MDTASLLKEIDAEIAQLQAARTAIAGLSSATVKRGRGRPKGSSKVATKRTMSPEGRKRIAEAQRKRWATAKKAK